MVDEVLSLHRVFLLHRAPVSRWLHRGPTRAERRTLHRLTRERGVGHVLAVVFFAMKDALLWMELPRLDHRLARWFDQLAQLRAHDLCIVREVAA